jgi:hypothetical protein
MRFRRWRFFLQEVFEGAENLRFGQGCGCHGSILPEYRVGVGTSWNL